MYALLPATQHIKQFSKLHRQSTVLISMFTNKQIYVNMVIRSWQHYRRFLGAISFLYHHDNVYPCADPGNFVGFGGGGWSKPD